MRELDLNSILSRPKGSQFEPQPTAIKNSVYMGYNEDTLGILLLPRDVKSKGIVLYCIVVYFIVV